VDVLLVFILNSVGLVEELWGTLTADSALILSVEKLQTSKQTNFRFSLCIALLGIHPIW
jgi:hypothetical protein